jgi:hypothetical protein
MMSQETNITLEPSRGTEPSEPSASSSSKDYKWVKCVGCDGEIGVPPGWEGDTADSPRCGTQVRVNGRLQYRPPNRSVAVEAAAPSARPITLTQKSPSIELQRKADAAMIFGIVCVFFGWTVLIPILSLIHFFKTKDGGFANEGVSALAKKEGVPVPMKATLGLILTFVFGGMQSLSLIIALSNHH